MEDMLVVADENGKSAPNWPSRSLCRPGPAADQGLAGRLRSGARDCLDVRVAFRRAVTGAGALDAGGAAGRAVPEPRLLSGIVGEGCAVRGGFATGSSGVRKAARVGGITAGIWLALVPAWLAGLYARSAELINPGGKSAILWRAVLIVATLVAIAHVGVSCLRGGRIRHFLWPFGHPFWLVRAAAAGGRVHRGPRQTLGLSQRACVFPISFGWGWWAFLARWSGWRFQAR